MKTFRVTYEVRTGNVQVDVEAESEHEAENEGRNRAIEIATGGWLEAHPTNCEELQPS